jgi:hypothetical protein
MSGAVSISISRQYFEDQDFAPHNFQVSIADTRRQDLVKSFAF